MRFPLKSEGDAFRMTVALGLVAGAAVLIGWLASPEYGVVMLAAGLAAGVVFELAGRDAGRGSPLRDASHEEHPHGAKAGQRHVLVVATAQLAGEELRRELTARGGVVELDVLAPILPPNPTPGPRTSTESVRRRASGSTSRSRGPRPMASRPRARSETPTR